MAKDYIVVNQDGTVEGEFNEKGEAKVGMFARGKNYVKKHKKGVAAIVGSIVGAGLIGYFAGNSVAGRHEYFDGTLPDDIEPDYDSGTDVETAEVDVEVSYI